jgi:amino acid transporter
VIGGREPLRGRKAGDRRIRVERPHSAYFRYTGKGVLTAKPKAIEPTTGLGKSLLRAKRILIGRPLATEEEIGERLSKKKALAIFSSDAISSSAYATEEILKVLVVAGAAALFASMWVAIAIVILLAVVSTSYRQIGYAYPSGGGAYAVAKDNLGTLPALVAAGSLLVDYVLTVAVSISSAVQQMFSAVPELLPWAVTLGIAAILLMTLGNLRGLRESGNIFAVPTYLFVFAALLMIVMGVYRVVVLHQGAPPPSVIAGAPPFSESLTIFLLLKAFASGSVALTGTEAIANGVPAFKPPESKNAATTLTAMAILLGILFIGITFVANAFGIVPIDNRTVISQVAATIYGDGSIGFYLFQAFTALILVLAANTSYNAFPRLAAILATDNYMPRHFAFRGDRLAYTLGIAILSGVAIGLLAAFGGDTHALIPLYSVGVFVSFTLSQGGMVKHWRRVRGNRWRGRLAINALGALMTGIVAVVVLIEKAPNSLLVAVIISLLVLMMLFINRQYAHAARELAVRPDLVIGPPRRQERAIIPVPALTRAVVQAVNFGRAITDDVQMVHVTDDVEEGERLRAQMEKQLPGVPFVIVESPFRSLVRPFVTYLDVTTRDPEAITLVIIPEYVARHWWERILYNQTANRLRAELLGRPNTVVANVPYRREEPTVRHGPERPEPPAPQPPAPQPPSPPPPAPPSSSRSDATGDTPAKG